MNIYDASRASDKVPMNRPHRTSEQVSDWVEDRAATVMNIDGAKFDDHLTRITPDFDAFGLSEYQAILKKSGIYSRVVNGKLKLNAIASTGTVLLNEGAIGDTYHWLYQVPLLLTYYNAETNSTDSAQNQNIMVRIQIGRIAKGDDDTAIVIERWSIVSGI